MARSLSASAAVDWASLAAKMPAADAKAELQSLKASFDSMQAFISSNSEAPAPIDFAAYKAKLGGGLNKAAGAEFVDNIEKMLPELLAEQPKFDFKSIPEYNAAIVELEAARTADVAVLEECGAELSGLKEKLALKETLMTNTETTVHDVFKMHPELEEEIDNEIANHEWDEQTK